MKRFHLTIMLMLLCGLIILAPSRSLGPPRAAPSESALPNYVIDWYSVNGGGTTDASSAGWRVGMSVGQSAAGEMTSTSWRAGVGFWYGAGPSCDCDCHADPQCDSIRSSMQDVVWAVQVAFRTGSAMPDPNPLCPWERTDVNCSGYTNISDVVALVDVAFRSKIPYVDRFCNPCP